ncbi:hypothetical protein Tco_1396343, partial [Tanacetum coccineum]
MHYSEQPVLVNDSNIEITSNNNVISYKQYLKENKNEVVQGTTCPEQQEVMIMSVIDEMSDLVSKCNAVNKENKIMNESLTVELERYKGMDHADTLREIVEQARALKPLDNALDYALKGSINASKAQLRINTRNNRISQPSSSNMKNKTVEVHPRNVKSRVNKINNVFVCNATVKHAVLNANSKFMCSTCNECLFSLNHDMCVVDYLNDVNARARAKFVKSVKKNEWKPTGKVFTNVRYRWLPIGRTFTMVGTKCPLTRITSTKIMPPRKLVPTTVITNKPPSRVSQWRHKETTT